MVCLEWNELIVKTTNEAKEAVANVLNEFGANGVVIEESFRLSENNENRFGELYELTDEKFHQKGVTIKAYFLNDEKWDELKGNIVSKIENLYSFNIQLGELSISVNQVAESDWEHEWKKYFKPFRVTERFTIVPTWETYNQEDANEQLIFMDPGMAFGTGTHATTKLSLLALENVVAKNDIVVDVGSGSGILSIAACLLHARHVYSYDLDSVAINSTIYNRDLNKLTDKITIRQNNLLENIAHSEQVDVVIANILAHIILQLVDDAWQQLKVGGYFIASGIIRKEQRKVREKLITSNFSIVDTLLEDNWVTFIARKNDK